MRDLAGTGTSGSIDDQGGGGGKGRVAGGVVAGAVVGDGRCVCSVFLAVFSSCKFFRSNFTNLKY